MPWLQLHGILLINFKLINRFSLLPLDMLPLASNITIYLAEPIPVAILNVAKTLQID